MLGKGTEEDVGRDCRFWDCGNTTRYTWCFEHYRAFKQGDLDLCPGCGKGKWVSYGVCGRCRVGNGGGKSGVEEELVAAPPKGGVGATLRGVYYVYLLEVEGRGWYSEHAEDLAGRLREHRAGKVGFTAGRDVKLEWFVMVPTRDQALELQGQLRLIGERDSRELEEWVKVFAGFVSEIVR